MARIRGINTKYYVGRGHDGEAAVSSLLEGRPSRRPRSHRGRAVVGASGGPRIRMTAALDSGKKCFAVDQVNTIRAPVGR